MVNTGEDSLTGDRIREIKSFIDGDFCLTYGDGLSEVNIKDTIKLHKKNNKIETGVTGNPTGRFGAITLKGNLVKKFFEKPKGDGAWVNGGFFVLNKKIFNYLSDKNCIWEKEPLEKIAKDNQLTAYKHHGFWHAMDTLRDRNYLEDMWSSNQVPWKIWDE